MRRLGFVALCWMLFAAVLTLAPASATETPISPALCLENGGAGIVFKTDDMSCPASFCFDDSQCWEHCTQAISATCSGGTCHYVLPGGGTGGSGSQCPEQRHCLDDSGCSYPLFGIQGTCNSGGTCDC